MFNTIIHLLYSGNPLNIVLNILFLIYFIILIIFYNKCKKNKQKLKIWKLLCFVPLIISILHILIFVLGSAFLTILPMYKSIYILAVLIALTPLLTKKKLIYNIGKIIIVITSVYFFVESFYSNKITNYTRKSLSDSYVALCDYFEENYIMNDWKRIDYEKLKSEGLLLVKESEETGDVDKYYEALQNFVNEFHDGHMGLSFYNDKNYTLEQIQKFNDYGLSLITLDDGSTIAIDVEETLEIKEGDVVTKWNGVPIDKAIDNIKLPIIVPVLENEKIMKTFYLSGLGSDTVEVTYINSSNKEVTTTLNKIDSEAPRALKSYGTFTRSKDDQAFAHKMLNNNTGYLKVGKETIDSFSDDIAYLTDNHVVAREMFRTYLRELREQGMTKLIIDARNNGGGYDEVATALASLFTKEKMYAFSLGIKKPNGLKKADDRYVIADGEFSDIEVIVLTNMRCASAGDALVLYLSRLDNVTIAGITNPEGINQETGGLVFMPEGAMIHYPTGVVLDQNGNPNIDVDNTRESRNPVDVKIPLTKESALRIFNGEDYELQWAIDYLL